jgi:hypothetical protein
MCLKSATRRCLGRRPRRTSDRQSKARRGWAGRVKIGAKTQTRRGVIRPGLLKRFYFPLLPTKSTGDFGTLRDAWRRRRARAVSAAAVAKGNCLAARLDSVRWIGLMWARIEMLIGIGAPEI